MSDKTTPAVGDLLLLDGAMHRITVLTARGTVQAEHPDGPNAKPRRFASMLASSLVWMAVGGDVPGFWAIPSRMLKPELVKEAATVTAATATATATATKAK